MWRRYDGTLNNPSRTRTCLVQRSCSLAETRMSCKHSLMLRVLLKLRCLCGSFIILVLYHYYCDLQRKPALAGETNYALGLLALLLPQVYFAKTLFIEDPIKNDVSPGCEDGPLQCVKQRQPPQTPIPCAKTGLPLTVRKYQGSSLPFFSIGTIVAASAIGNNPLH